MIKYEENILKIEDIQAIRKAVHWSMFTENQLQQTLNMTVYSIVVKDDEKCYRNGEINR